MATKSSDLVSGITNAVRDVTQHWARQRKAEERDRSREFHRWDRLVRSDRITIREAAFSVMEEAYLKASDNGRLPARPRQIMYAARPEILELTGKDTLVERYFTQTLLPDYINEHGEAVDWDIVWDARGHFTEPHTGKGTPLGTLEVRDYLGERAQRSELVSIDRSVLYPTHGPKHRFDTALFVEKEGFDPLFAAEQLAERFDLAIMSTKGMSVTAARILLDRLCDRGLEKIFVLHDFDISGFSIFGTLGTSGRRYRFANDVPVIDLGLRLVDVEAMSLQSEPVAVSGNWFKRAATLKRHRATVEEIDFLRNRRVELNATTSRELLDFIEAGLDRHGVAKIIPDDTVLEEHARRLIERHLAHRAIEPLQAGFVAEAQKTALPAKLREQLEAALDETPENSWDSSLSTLIALLLRRGGPPRSAGAADDDEE
jgi:hypothetical protein